ncbi:MAG: GNAT family N-acetyltransferase, partial [Bacteroidales bacterium]|nr:GNAT family N-acetyltransferase [Bacteroidales bacterium]
MKPIIDPVPVELLKAELTPSKKLEDTNKGHNELYIVTWQDSPNVVTEIGRLRELVFRDAGGSTGNEIDLDEYDKMEKPYKQLIVWDPDAEEIIGGYRFIFGSDAVFDENGQPMLASSHQFRFSQKFIDDYLPYVIELGRNFVVPSKDGKRSIFALDN